MNEIELIIKPKNIWQSKFDILKGGIDKGDIVFTRKGDIVITLDDKIGNEEPKAQTKYQTREAGAVEQNTTTTRRTTTTDFSTLSFARFTWCNMGM